MNTRTYIETISLLLLTPSDLRCPTFAETKHPQHLTHPTCNVVHEVHVEALTAGIDVDVGLGNYVPKDIHSPGRVERIAKGFAKRCSSFMEASRIFGSAKGKGGPTFFESGRTLWSIRVQPSHNDGSHLTYNHLPALGLKVL